MISKSSSPSRLKDLYRRIVRDRSVRRAFFVFALTRSIVFVIFVLAAHSSMHPASTSEDPHPIISLHGAKVGRNLRHTMSRGDAGWYLAIAELGYEHEQFSDTEQRRWGFFPLYPLLMRAVGSLTGEYILGGAALSNVFFFFALVILHKLVGEYGFDEQTADRAVFYLATFPTSYFFSLPMTESLFLLLIVSAFYAGVRKRWWAAGAVGALASATRVNGVLLLPALLILYWQRNGKSFKPRPDVLWLSLVPFGLFAFMFFLWTITGNAFAFKDILVTWDRHSGFFLFTLLQYIANPLELAAPWNFIIMNFAAGCLSFVVVYFWVRRAEWNFALYTLASVFLPLSSMTLISLTRYTVVVFPVFIALAIAGRSARVDQIINIVFISLFSLMTLFYALRFSFAST